MFAREGDLESFAFEHSRVKMVDVAPDVLAVAMEAGSGSQSDP